MSFPQIEWADGYENGYKEQKKKWVDVNFEPK